MTTLTYPPPPGTADLAFRCRGLVKRFEDVVAVDGLDLEARRGECLALLGPNGAGKTTTVEILEGLTRADSGEVEVLGCRWGGGGDRALRARLGIQLQETHLGDRLTVGEIVRMFRSFYSAGSSVDELLALLGLTASAGVQVRKLSGGQRQRLALSCALVGDPGLLFLDEPTTGLDPQARLRIWGVIKRFRDRGGTVLLTTHYMEEAARLSDRVTILDHGRKIAEGCKEELIRSLGADQVVRLRVTGSVEEEALAALPGITSVGRSDPNELQLGVSDVRESIPALLAELERRAVRLDSLTTHQPTLEDVFVSLTGKGLRDD